MTEMEIDQGKLNKAIKSLTRKAWFMVGAVALYGAILKFVPGLMGQSQNSSLYSVVFWGLIAFLMFSFYILEALLGKRKTATNIDEAIDNYAIVMLARFVPRDTIAIVGAVASFLTNDFTWYFAFGAISLVSLILIWPTEEALKKFVRRALGAETLGKEIKGN